MSNWLPLKMGATEYSSQYIQKDVTPLVEKVYAPESPSVCKVSSHSNIILKILLTFGQRIFHISHPLLINGCKNQRFHCLKKVCGVNTGHKEKRDPSGGILLNPDYLESSELFTIMKARRTVLRIYWRQMDG
jgi:hypothetical protein